MTGQTGLVHRLAQLGLSHQSPGTATGASDLLVYQVLFENYLIDLPDALKYITISYCKS